MPEFILKDTSESSIEPILACFDNPFQHKCVRIVLDRNTGGTLPPVMDLISRIKYSDSDVCISIGVNRYIFSAAAVFYFSLLFGKECGDFANVEFSELAEPILVLFHKPRICEGGEFIRFDNETQSDSGTETGIVERTFRRFLVATGNSEIKVVPNLEGFEGMKHKNQHFLDALENNYDCIFLWDGSARS